MLAVHFGAGNIGRGFIGMLLSQAGYHTVFVDVNEKLINELNERKQYDVELAAEHSEAVTVSNVSGINSIENSDEVVEAIAEADVVTTAVGPNVLAVIAEVIAKGLQKRNSVTNQPLNLIACENMIGGSSLLKEKVFEHVPGEEREKYEALYGFPDAAVDRIVPNQVNEDPLKVAVEPYFEWVVEEAGIIGEKPDINGVTYVEDLKPFIERKLFTVNTGHAIPAYVGSLLGYTRIKEAMEDRKVREIIEGALHESGEALIHEYGFDRSKHQKYIQKIIQRFLNPYISDEVTRVGRGPIRKLGANDRLVRPARLYMELTGKEPIHLAKAIAAALLYVNEADEEALRLQQLIADSGFKHALSTVSGLEKSDPLVGVIMTQVEDLKRQTNK